MYLILTILVNRNYFEFLYVIGRGGFGKVWKVRLKKTNEYFALKEMFKVKVIDRRSEFSIMSERNLLSKLKHPFIVNMYFAFQDFSKLYLVLDLLTGGDLRYHIAKIKTFTEPQTKFIIANLILSLEYIHSQKIIHRDIKPENLVLDSKGYVRLTDFGVAKINEADNSSETSGTPGYMAPEVILIQNHSYPSDFFALGVIGYEFMKGYRPYLGRSRKEIKELIMHKQAKIKTEELPKGWGILAAEFINALLERKPSKRLGYKNISEIKEHPWMEDIDWDLLAKKELKAPFLPYTEKENFDKEYCEGEEKIGNETLERYEEYTKSEGFEELFFNYTYLDMKKVVNYQKEYNDENNNYNSNKIYNDTNYNVQRKILNEENFKTISIKKDKMRDLSNKSLNSNHNSPKLANIKIITNYICNSKTSKIKIKDIIGKDIGKQIIKSNSNSNQGIRLLSQNNSKKKLSIKETAFDLLKNKQQFKNVILQSLLRNNKKDNDKKEKKFKKEKNKVDLSKIHKFFANNGRKINFNMTKNLFLNKSNSVKIVKPKNPDELIHYNNYILKKKEENNTSSLSRDKNINNLKNRKKNNDFKTALIQQYLKNKNINNNKLNKLINNDKLNNKNNSLKRKKNRNNSQIEGEEFSKKIKSLLNHEEKKKEKNNKKNEFKKSKNILLNHGANLYNIMTLNKNKSKNFKKNHKNINNNSLTKENNNRNYNSTHNINNNIKTKSNNDNETIINHFYHPKLTINNKLNKNKIFNYLSNLNIHSKNKIPIYNKFPFIHNINTLSNSPKNMLTININDSYSKDLINGKVINIHNHNFLTSNNIRSQKNIRNIIVNNISPTVNVLIHSEGKKLLKNKKLKGEKKRINNKSKNDKINEKYYETENKVKNKRKNINDSKRNFNF